MIQQRSRGTHTRLKTVDGKKVREHRWLMEQELGRKLLPTEHVHHINGDPLDNRIENLMVLDQNAHIRLHKQQYPDEKVCQTCGKTYTPNPRKRNRQKTCSPECATALRNLHMSATKSRRFAEVML